MHPNESVLTSQKTPHASQLKKDEHMVLNNSDNGHADRPEIAKKTDDFQVSVEHGKEYSTCETSATKTNEDDGRRMLSTKLSVDRDFSPASNGDEFIR